MIFPILFYVIAYFISLFYFCIFCQYKLYQSRPQDKNELTFFYLIISLGGFLGSLLVTWLAPLIFSLPLEYLLGIFVVSVSVAIKGERISVGSGYIRFLAYLVAIIFLWPIVFRHYNFFALTLIIFMFYFIFKELGRKPTALYLSILALLFIAPFVEELWSRDGYSIYVHRNYYGIVKVVYRAGARLLMSGTTIHGGQFIDKKKENELVTYYHKNTPVNKLFESRLLNLDKIGVAGLGIGNIAAFLGSGQSLERRG